MLMRRLMVSVDQVSDSARQTCFQKRTTLDRASTEGWSAPCGSASLNDVVNDPGTSFLGIIDLGRETVSRSISSLAWKDLVEDSVSYEDGDDKRWSDDCARACISCG